jgi:hypothetical protein
VLRRLSIETVRLGALGRGIRLTAVTLSRIKELGDRAKPQADVGAEAEAADKQ